MNIFNKKPKKLGVLEIYNDDDTKDKREYVVEESNKIDYVEASHVDYPNGVAKEKQEPQIENKSTIFDNLRNAAKNVFIGIQKMNSAMQSDGMRNMQAKARDISKNLDSAPLFGADININNNRNEVQKIDKEIKSKVQAKQIIVNAPITQTIDNDMTKKLADAKMKLEKMNYGF